MAASEPGREYWRSVDLIRSVHQGLVFGRRVRRLADHIAGLLPDTGRVLDVGCGDGSIAAEIMERRPGIAISGIDVLVRGHTHIPVVPFDGTVIPYDAGSFDAVMFVDVLHHTEHPEALLREAQRVSRGPIVVKDHTRDGPLAGGTLRFMDWVGNAHHGVALPYNYWSRKQWDQAFDDLGLAVRSWDGRPGLYPWPASLVFDRSLHFVAILAGTEVNGAGARPVPAQPRSEGPERRRR